MEGGRIITMTLAERLLSKVAYEPNTGCWLWTGFVNGNGYGQINYEGAPRNAHRISYLVHFGEFDRSLFVCHVCDVRSCINPQHLFLGTSSDNSLDMWRKKRHPIENLRKKLTVDDVRYIRKSKETSAVLSERYGCSTRNITGVRSMELWKHVI